MYITVHTPVNKDTIRNLQIYDTVKLLISLDNFRSQF